MEAIEVARAINDIPQDSSLRALEDGPFGGNPVFVGGEKLAEVVSAPLDKDIPWSCVAIRDYSVAQAARQLTKGRLWLPRVSEQDVRNLPIAHIDEICKIGVNHNNIVGNGSQTAFELIRPLSISPTYPMLWNHHADRETRLVVPPDSEGLIKRGRERRAAEIWETRSHAHHNADFRFNSQPLAVAYTDGSTIGGRAWKNVKCGNRAEEIVYTLWGNSTLGLLCYWWHSSRQQAGRGSMPISAIRTMPTLDVTQLNERQLAAAEDIFDDMRNSRFLPANEAYRDNTRQELDYRVLVDMLGLPKTLLEPLELLRHKWCLEPSVHGGKSTAPNANA